MPRIPSVVNHYKKIGTQSLCHRELDDIDAYVLQFGPIMLVHIYNCRQVITYFCIINMVIDSVVMTIHVVAYHSTTIAYDLCNLTDTPDHVWSKTRLFCLHIDGVFQLLLGPYPVQLSRISFLSWQSPHARPRDFFSTLAPGSGRFQLTNLMGYS